MDFHKIEEKWQKLWEKDKVFLSKEDPKKKKYYVLEMFPYPSGAGLHMGHALNYTIGDIYARFKRMTGFNVLYPMGYDAFGLPAENAAIKAGEHPLKYTQNSISNFIKQQKALGLSYDWERKLVTYEPIYYKWNQYFFLKLYEKGLVYRKKSAVNWCPKCNTVLANEQVHNGKCWRHEDTEVEIKQLEQWFIKTTAYSEELLSHIKNLDWPERIKIMQENWIGKSYGTEILFEINNEKWPIFTTRPDTLFGVTFMVISAQHPKLFDLVTNEQKKEVEKFVKKLNSVSEKKLEEMDKEGVFTGSYAINPLTKDKVPVYAGNFVIADYGSGMVMAVPAHDQRDFEFAKKYKIPIKVVVNPNDFDLDSKKMSRAYVGDGSLINSGEFDGTNNRESIDDITKHLQKLKLGKKVVQYKLRDWLISRQRYWGTPIPFIYCDKCGIVPVPEKDLPVILPENVKFGEGNPLVTNKEFVNCKCPKCNGPAKRETDTMDTFMDSAWYFLRFADNKNEKKPFEKKKIDYWLPVDTYIGGAEHACMHLIYSRFFVKALRDMGYLNFDEPFIKLFNQGMLHGSDGQKMSKSLGNVINPIDVVDKYSADSLRFNLMSLSSPDKDSNWSDKNMESCHKFISKIVNYFENVKIGKSTERTESKLNKTIKEVTSDINSFNYNLAIIKIRKLFESFNKEESKDTLFNFLKLLHPICPHITEELWKKLGNKGYISLESWPVADDEKINEKFEKEEALIETLVNDVNNIVRIIKEKGNSPKKVFVYVIPKEKETYINDLEEIKRRINLDLQIFAVNDSDKHDPENKSVKAKPGKPAIYVE